MLTTAFPLIVIVGPAAVGKTTIIKALLKKYPILRSSVTYTTRAPRTKTGPEDKVMHYVSDAEFTIRKLAGEFIETALVHGEWYGTHEKETMALLSTNPLLFNIDLEGMRQIKKCFGEQVITIFIAPESLEIIIERLRSRGESTKADFDARVASAKVLLEKQEEFDHCIVNREGHLEEAVNQISLIIEPFFTLDKSSKV